MKNLKKVIFQILFARVKIFFGYMSHTFSDPVVVAVSCCFLLFLAATATATGTAQEDLSL